MVNDTVWGPADSLHFQYCAFSFTFTTQPPKLYQCFRQGNNFKLFTLLKVTVLFQSIKKCWRHKSTYSHKFQICDWWRHAVRDIIIIKFVCFRQVYEKQ